MGCSAEVLVIPAKAGIQLLALIFGVSSESFHSLRERVTSLLVQRSNQESTFLQIQRRVRRMDIHVTCGERRTSCAPSASLQI
jgi:hypothetical protein